MLKKLYKFIGKYINGLPTQTINPVIEEFEKMEKEKNRIIPIMEQQIFPFLLANGIEPVIISGSPKEPLETYKKRMGFQNVYALEYKIEDGKYTDEYSINTSVGDGKEWIIQNFLE